MGRTGVHQACCLIDADHGQRLPATRFAVVRIGSQPADVGKLAGVEGQRHSGGHLEEGPTWAEVDRPQASAPIGKARCLGQLRDADCCLTGQGARRKVYARAANSAGGRADHDLTRGLGQHGSGCQLTQAGDLDLDCLLQNDFILGAPVCGGNQREAKG